MNRTDRLLAIVLELQRRGRGYMRAEDLATTFEVSKRTIYRDVEALCAAGVPIAVAARQGYALVEGYFLPPLSFTADEALILALGSDVVATSFDVQYRKAARSAARKIDAVLPPALRDQVAQLRQGIGFNTTRPLGQEQLGRLQLLRRAVAERRRVQFRYRSRDPETSAAIETARDVDPHLLTRHVDDWYLSAYCHLRQAMRSFRLARMEDLRLLDIPFDRTSTPEWGEHTAEPVFVQALFGREAAAWVRESIPGTLIEEIQMADGLLLTLLAQPGQSLTRWLLGWGAGVQVIEPAWLQQIVIEQAEQMLQSYRATLSHD
jgi:predicted DNA-binding transcriptional regulator YafY